MPFKLFTPPTTTPDIMLRVLLALVPAIAVYVWVFGAAILVSLLLASVTALASEAAMLKLRRQPLKPYLTDNSALVTAWLLALSLPPLLPWWLIVTTTAFAIVIAKQLYGGLGNNLFNPAMVGYAVAIIAFPLQATQWLAPDALLTTHLNFAEQLRYMFTGSLPAGLSLDAITMATPLDALKTGLRLHHPLPEITAQPIFGKVGGLGGEIIALAYLAGGVYLWQQRVITWHIPLAFIGALLLISGVFHLADSSRYVAPWFHLASGASLIAAFFILTDPVSGPTTAKGKIIYAASAAGLVYVIRVFGGYPDGVAFAVLLLNICVPLIDLSTQPPVFGKKNKPKH